MLVGSTVVCATDQITYSYPQLLWILQENSATIGIYTSIPTHKCIAPGIAPLHEVVYL